MILKLVNTNSEDSQDILAADVGATKINIAVYHWNGMHLILQKEASYRSKHFKTITSAIREFIDGHELPPKISLAVAGPVKSGNSRLTNINWELDAEELSRYFLRDVVLVNDMEASAYGLGLMDEKDIHIVHKGSTCEKGNVAIIAPGTGLGEAGLYYDGEVYHPFATEGGHSDFAPRTTQDFELLQFARKKYGHVSWERLISGPGICLIYDFLLQKKDRTEPSWIREKILAHDKATVITQNISECAVCKETVELFFHYLAQESANVAMKFMATSGVYISGGIVPELVADLNHELFVRSFSNFGRLKDLLESIPIKIILNKQTALIGAAFYGVHHQQFQSKVLPVLHEQA
jgi:glucokinase